MTTSSPDPNVTATDAGVDDRVRPRWQRDWLGTTLLVVLTAALWFMRRRGPAQAMEEAMMLQAPLRVLHGGVQGRDFDYFYGPVSLYVPALAYKIAAPTLIVERAVGAVYLAVLGVALYFVGRRWSFWIGLCMGATAVLIGSLSISALPITGAIAFLVAAVAFATSDRSDTARAWAVGLCLAMSVDLRPDFAVWAVVLLVVLTLLGTARLATWVIAVAGLFPYLIVVIQAGWSPTFRTLVSDGLRVSSERRIPFHLEPGNRGLLVVVGWAFVVGALVLGLMLGRNRRGVGLVGLGVIGVCQVPEFLQRSDGTHAVYVTMVPLALVAPVVDELADRVGWFAARPQHRQVVAVGVAVVVLSALQPKFVLRATLRDARVQRARGDRPRGAEPGRGLVLQDRPGGRGSHPPGPCRRTHRTTGRRVVRRTA